MPEVDLSKSLAAEAVLPAHRLALYPRPHRLQPPFPGPKPKPGEEIGRLVGGVVLQPIADFVDQVPAAVSAVGHFIENTFHSAGERLSHAERRLREGKIVDAYWHSITDVYSSTEKNAFKAAQESSLVRAGIEYAATSVGPEGAAAFTAWYTYRNTNNATQAVCYGVVAALKAYGLADIDKAMEVKNTDDLFAKAIVSGAVGGLAVAAMSTR